MRTLRDITVRSKLAILIGIALAGLFVFGLVAYQTLQRVKVSGPMYKEITGLRALTTDLAPPTLFIVDPHFLARKMATDNAEELRADVQSFSALVNKYNATYQEYEHSVPPGKIRDALTGVVHETAMRYFDAVQNQYIPALLRGDHKAASEIEAGTLSPAFNEHRAAVDGLEKLAEDEIAAQENRAQSVVDERLRILGMVAILAATVVLLLGYVIVQTVGKPVRAMEEVARKLAQGDMDVEVTADSRDEIGKLAASFREMSEMIKSRAAAAERIAAGDLSVDIRAASESDVLANSLNTLIANLKKLLGEMERMASAHQAGEIDVVVDPAHFTGAYREVATGINQMVGDHIRDITTAIGCMGEFGNGNFEAAMPQLPGKKALVNHIIEQVRGNLKALIADTGMLAESAVNGDLSSRADASRHKGDFAKIVAGINSALDSIIGPLNAAINALNALAHGAVPERVDGDYRGEYARLKTSIEVVTGVVKERKDDLDRLLSHALAGDLSTRADASKYTGSNARLISGMNELLDACVTPLREFSAVLDRLAAGDLTAKIDNDYKGEFEEVKQSINELSDHVREAMQHIGGTTVTLLDSAHELNQVSREMTTASQDTAARAGTVSAASEQVNRNMQSVASGADEMGASIREIAKSTAEATQIAVRAVSSAKTANQTVESLGTSSAEIGQVVKVITSIAEQTNLLALNATIEAARAGESGKGFAVVANEVKELAKETAKATDDIQRRIEAIQNDAHSAVAAIAEIGSIIDQINGIQNTVASAVEQQSATTSEMSRNLNEAAAGTTDINRNIGSVADSAQSTSSGATKTNRSAQQLEQLASELRELIGHFRCGDQAPAVLTGARLATAGSVVQP